MRLTRNWRVIIILIFSWRLNVLHLDQLRNPTIFACRLETKYHSELFQHDYSKGINIFFFFNHFVVIEFVFRVSQKDQSLTVSR